MCSNLPKALSMFPLYLWRLSFLLLLFCYCLFFKDRLLEVEFFGIKAYVSKILIDTASFPLKHIFKCISLYVKSENALFHIILPTHDLISPLKFWPTHEIRVFQYLHLYFPSHQAFRSYFIALLNGGCAPLCCCPLPLLSHHRQPGCLLKL